MNGVEALLRALARAAFDLRWGIYEGVPERSWAAFCARYDQIMSVLKRDDEALSLLHLLGVRAYALRFDPSQRAWQALVSRSSSSPCMHLRV